MSDKKMKKNFIFNILIINELKNYEEKNERKMNLFLIFVCLIEKLHYLCSLDLYKNIKSTR